MKGDLTVNKIEAMLLEQMREEKFQQAVIDNFDFVDSLIDHEDLDKLSDEEDT